MVSIKAVNGAVHIVPMRQSRKSERGSLHRLKLFVREGKTDNASRLKHLLETPPLRFGEPSNPCPLKMKKISKQAHNVEANDD
jgi:hypothetical protein